MSKLYNRSYVCRLCGCTHVVGAANDAYKECGLTIPGEYGFIATYERFNQQGDCMTKFDQSIDHAIWTPASWELWATTNEELFTDK